MFYIYEFLGIIICVLPSRIMGDLVANIVGSIGNGRSVVMLSRFPFWNTIRCELFL
jgi:hypothetical protein